jgi:sugar transferase (PEP-CTERM system associated)
MQRMVRGYIPHGAPTDFVADSFLYALALIAVVSLTRVAGIANVHTISLVIFLSVGVLVAGVNATIGLYRNDANVSAQALGRAAAVWAITSLVLYMMAKTQPAGAGYWVAPEWMLIAWALGFGLIRPALYVLRGAGVGVRRVLIIGAGAEAVAIHRDLQQRNSSNTRLVGFFEAGPVVDPGAVANAALFPTSAGLWNVVQRWRISEVIVAVREQRGGVLPLRDLLECRIHGVRVVDETACFERLRGEFPIESLKASWLIYARGFEQGLARTVAKRILDVAGSLVLLAFLFPIMALAAQAIVLESRGPLIFRQERVGRGGRCFKLLKFRSMRADAEKDGVARWATLHDPRITRVGRLIRKTRIDELPQLINVLRGDMSLVGPRPERPTFVETLKADIRFYDVRHSVKPGVTGWAQIRYQYAASLEDSKRKLQFDLYYVKNHSLWLDLRILVETVRVVLRGEGAH